MAISDGSGHVPRPTTHQSATPGALDVARACWQRLTRPVRPKATPRWRLFPSWAEWFAASLVAAAATLAAMAWLDPLVQEIPQSLGAGARTFFQLTTDLGKSAWSLIPTGVGLLVILVAIRPARTFADRVALALALRLAFVFLAVGGSGLIATTVKRIIGRARPYLFEAHGSLHFDFMAWKPIYASFPSGHAQSAVSFAVAMAFLLPRWRYPLLIGGAAIAVTRIGVEAHYLSDIIAGGAWGAWFALMCREWFARRGLLFSPTETRAPFPLPALRARQAAGAVWSRMLRKS